jgi:hypothetical protein
MMCWKQTIILAFMVFLLGAIGCASYKHGIIDVRKVDEYPNNITVNGISVAVDPYDSSEKAKQGFFVDVTSKGFYPVQLIFKNNTDDRAIIFRETTELIDSSNNSRRPVRSTIMADACEHNKMAYALLGFGIFSYMSADEANHEMASDWKEKELPDQLILPAGKKISGFLYFQLPMGQTTKGYILKLEMEILETKEKIPLELVL